MGVIGIEACITSVYKLACYLFDGKWDSLHAIFHEFHPYIDTSDRILQYSKPSVNAWKCTNINYLQHSRFKTKNCDIFPIWSKMYRPWNDALSLSCLIPVFGPHWYHGSWMKLISTQFAVFFPYCFFQHEITWFYQCGLLKPVWTCHYQSPWPPQAH